ncbi:MAG: response regulator transcription factor [Gammaproteobacteria bacterium]|nr:response regulator transcription factor [Gammaproteobacteria bacterium]
MRIAVVDDSPELSELIALWLEEAGHDVSTFVRGNAFIQGCKMESFDVILLDWELPDINGDEILTMLQSQPDWNTPVIFITARSREEDIVNILDRGADDYVTKPIQRRELLARIGAVTRRNSKSADRKLQNYGIYQIDLNRRTVYVKKQPVKLTEIEFNLVYFLFTNAGRLLSRNHILSSVWGYGTEMNTRTVDTHVSRIRKKLDISLENGWQLISIYQRGYRLEHISADDTLLLPE